MLNKIKHFMTKYAYIYLPIGTLLCLAGFIGSYLFPNTVLDTYKVNVGENEGDTEYVQYFTGTEDEIGYMMETDGRVMKGIQIGIDKNGQALEGTSLIYRIYKVGDSDFGGDVASHAELLEEESFDLGSCMDGQYPYLPFINEADTGKLYITFSYQANGNTQPAPGIFMNHSDIENAATYVSGARSDGSIKCYYIYSHETYPFLYDSRVMFCIFLAASACVVFPAYSRKKEVGKSNEN
ncbi:MAG: hypothetical protein MRZ47_05975 [Lachnospiraceae bacterium]|nr:hypothetical protein [Lachnospiraceae bacterium]